MQEILSGLSVASRIALTSPAQGRDPTVVGLASIVLYHLENTHTRHKGANGV
jgi:hypothetical protein